MSDLKAIDELDEQLWKLQNATLHDGADANHRRQQINRNTAKAALLKWRDKEVKIAIAKQITKELPEVAAYIKEEVDEAAVAEAEKIYDEYSFGGKSEIEFGKWLKERIKQLEGAE